MVFHSAFNSLWEKITFPLFLHRATTTPPPPSAPSKIPIPLPENRLIESDTTNDKFSSVGCPLISNLPAGASMPGAYHPDLAVLSTSSIGRPSYGFCSSISTSPFPFPGCEEGEFGDRGFAGYSTSEGSPTCASSQPSPYSRDGPTEPNITSRRSLTSSLPGRSELAGFTPPTNSNLLSTSRSSDRTRPAESATPGGYSNSPSPGCSGPGYFALSHGSSYSSSELSSIPSSELSSIPSSELSSIPSSELSSIPSSPSSPLPSASSSSLFPSPAASANFPSTQDNNTFQSSSKGECRLDTKGVNMRKAPPGSPVLSKFIQGRTPETYTRMPNFPQLFMKTREYRRYFPDISLAKGLPNSQSSSGFFGKNKHVSYAKKRALKPEADIEVCPARGASKVQPSRIPARKKARLAAKSSDSKTTTKGAATPKGSTRVPLKIPRGTHRARRAALAEPLTSPSPPLLDPPPPPPLDPPTKPKTLSCSCRKSLPRIPRRRKRARDDDVTTGSIHKKLKTDCTGPHKTSKRKPRQPTNSVRPQRNTRACHEPSNCQPMSCLPRPVKPSNLSTPTKELVGGYRPVPIGRAPLAKGTSVTPLAKTTSPKKRTSKNTIVKSAVTKRPRKEYFQEGMVLEYESGDDAETRDEKLDMKEAQSTTPPPAHTSTTSATTPTSMAKPKSPLPSILGKRTSSNAQGSNKRDVGNKKVRRDYLEGRSSDYKSDEKPITHYRAYRHSPRGRIVDFELAPSLTDFSTPTPRRRWAKYTTKEEDSSKTSD